MSMKLMWSWRKKELQDKYSIQSKHPERNNVVVIVNTYRIALFYFFLGLCCCMSVTSPPRLKWFTELWIFLEQILFYFRINKYLYAKFNRLIIMEDINRLKIVLVEKKRTGKWLAEQLGKNPSTVSKWCSNVAQPDLATLVKIANLLEVGVQDLVISAK